MNFFQVLFSPITPEEREQFQRDYDPTPAQEVELNAEEDLNYVENMRAFAQRESWLGEDGLSHWQETIIDQHGHTHIVASGSFYAGQNGYAGHDDAEIVPVYCGEIVDE